MEKVGAISTLDALNVASPEVPDRLLVPFKVRRARRAAVAWINKAYFLEAGFDVEKSAVLQEVNDWLLDCFAYCVDESEGFNASDEELYFADRYGNGGLGGHGGSGRVGIRGNFQIKGVGPTPLVGEVREWGYSHGCLWLEEAIRETIFSELVFAEFPYGAVPTVAIVDLGFSYERSGEKGERRALLIRPMVMRPAHLERALRFSVRGSGLASVEGQLADVARVASASRWLIESCSCANVRTPLCCLEAFISKIAAQMAFGRVHRLFHGGYFSSNLTVDGRLIDFGSFRAVDSWAASFSGQFVPPFGHEHVLVHSIVESLCVHLDKCEESGVRDLRTHSRRLVRFVDSELNRQTAEYVRQACGSHLNAIELGTMERGIAAFYASQQRRRGASLAIARDWIGLVLPGLDSEESSIRSSSRIALSAQLGAAAAELVASDSLLRSKLRRLLSCRDCMFRERLQAAIFAGLERGDLGGEVEIGDFVDRWLTMGRRWWPTLPDRFDVIAQRLLGASAFLVCWDACSAEFVLWLEGPLRDGRIHVLGHSLNLSGLEFSSVARSKARIGVSVPMRLVEFRDGAIAEIMGGTIQLPSDWKFFPGPNLERWKAYCDGIGIEMNETVEPS